MYLMNLDFSVHTIFPHNIKMGVQSHLLLKAHLFHHNPWASLRENFRTTPYDWTSSALLNHKAMRFDSVTLHPKSYDFPAG